MKIKVKDIAEISTGIYVKTHKIGEVYYLQARDFDDSRKLKKITEPNAAKTESIERHFLDKGDVLVAAKGDDNFAALYAGIVTPAVASSVFLVVRNIDQDRVLPEFLTWQINHQSVQSYLKRKAKGTSISSINKSVLGEMLIEVPTIEAQKLIVEFDELRLKEKKIKQELEHYKTLYIDKQLLKAIKQ